MRAGGHRYSRPQIAFRAVNTRNDVGYNPGLQRHHLLPCQLLSQRCFGRMFAEVGLARIGFDDFRRNGLLLPATESYSMLTGMPLHRGPHRVYNEVVIARVGRIESRWAIQRQHDQSAGLEALMRLHLLQGALRRQLLAERRRMMLSRKDPLGTGFDFTQLDAMAEQLWAAQ